jgi:hypothetical protein
MNLKTVEIGGVRYRWRDILKLRREQSKADRKHQPPLFELRDDSRPDSQKTATGRLQEPTLFNT